MTSKTSPSPPTRARTTLTSLPTELLTSICLLGDCFTACSLARVAPGFAAAADSRLWRDLNLTLNPHYGDTPSIEQDSSLWMSSSRSRDWHFAQAQDVECRHRVGLREKLGSILDQADCRRCAMVRSVTITSRPGAGYETMRLLELTSPYLRTLRIEGIETGRDGFDLTRLWSPPTVHLFEHRLRFCAITFTSLRHLYLAKHSIRFERVIPHICDLAPSLHRLHVHIDDYEDEVDSQLPKIPVLSAKSSIRELFIITPYGEDFHDEHADSIRRLLRYTRAVKQLCIDSGPLALECVTLNPLVSALGALPDLEDLVWQIRSGEFNNALPAALDDPEEATSVFPSLRRLLLSGEPAEGDEKPPCRQLEHIEYPAISSLESVFLTSSVDDRLRPSSSPHTIASNAYRPHPRLMMQLKAARQLRIIHTLQETISPVDPNIFDHLGGVEGRDSANGYINSIHHGDDELFFLRFLLQDVEIADNPIDDQVWNPPPGITNSYYRLASGVTRQTVRYHQVEASWQLFSDFRNDVVPIEILERMREIEGKSVKQWRGRGIEVGEEAWRVLVDWHKGYLASEGRSDEIRDY